MPRPCPGPAPRGRDTPGGCAGQRDTWCFGSTGIPGTRSRPCREFAGSLRRDSVDRCGTQLPAGCLGSAELSPVVPR